MQMARKGQGIGIVEGLQGSFGGEDFLCELVQRTVVLSLMRAVTEAPTREAAMTAIQTAVVELQKKAPKTALLIEKGFGWLKHLGPLRQVKLRGLEKVDWLFVFSCAMHHLARLPKRMAQPSARLREQCA